MFVAGTLLIGGNLLLSPFAGFDAGWPTRHRACRSAALATLFWLLVAPAVARLPAGSRRRALPLAVAGWIVLIGAWVAIVQLQARSPWLVLAAMAIVWIADTAAYFTGRAFGRRKLAPHVSPGKTWEGVYGGLAAVALYALALVPLAADGRLRGHGVAACRNRSGSRCALALAGAFGRGRPVRVAAEAAGRREGQRTPPAGTRRRSRSHRRPACGDAGGGAAGARLPAMSRRRISVLGATGSIGDSTLDVIARHPDRFASPRSPRTANGKSSRSSASVHRPGRRRAVESRRGVASSSARLPRAGLPTRVLAGEAGLVEAARLARRRHRRRGDRRRGGPALDAGRGARGQAHSAREQGGARHRRRGIHAGGRSGRGDAAADRQRAQRDIPMPAARATRGSPAESGVRRIVLTASGGPFRTRPLAELPTVTRGRSLCPSQLGDGSQDQRRLCDHDEQGSRDDRSALAVRRAAGADRGRRASGKRHPFARRIR